MSEEPSISIGVISQLRHARNNRDVHLREFDDLFGVFDMRRVASLVDVRNQLVNDIELIELGHRGEVRNCQSAKSDEQREQRKDPLSVEKVPQPRETLRSGRRVQLVR